MGLEAGFSIREKTIELKRGDRLLLYSDGLTEVRNAKDKMYGRKRLSKVLATTGGLNTETMLRRVISDWDFFRGSVTPEDDTCVMAIYKR